MKQHLISSFTVGDYHCNLKGYYRVESSCGDAVIYRYIDSGVQVEGSQKLLKTIERNHLGYNLPSLKQAKIILSQRGEQHPDIEDLAAVKLAGAALHEERKNQEKGRIQILYEARLRNDGKTPSVIQLATKRRESGCHKCRHTPLLSEILYECPTCGGMVCRNCGSCLCNWNPKNAEENTAPHDRGTGL